MIVQADARFIPLPDESVQCVVTSPPYWGLRKYAGEQELIWRSGDLAIGRFENHEIAESQDRPIEWRGGYGLEPTVEMYIEHTVLILREIRRVLRKDGVVFWNVGDSYSAGGRKDHGTRQGDKQQTNTGSCVSFRMPDSPGIKPKDLCLIPMRVALAAQADGWWVRSDIIWSKPNPMPESCQDRPTDAYEHILMLTKSARYYWDAEAVKEQKSPLTISDERGNNDGQRRDRGLPGSTSTSGTNLGGPSGGRNLRNVWEFATQPNTWAHCRACGHTYDSKMRLPKRKVKCEDGTERTEVGCSLCGAWGQWTEHFAIFPEELPRRCIKAATSEKGCCPQCSAPWVRVVEKKLMEITRSDWGDKAGNWTATSGTMTAAPESKTLGWRAGCGCGGLLPDDLEPIESPTGERTRDDPSMETGRAGYNRPRGLNEGKRRITRYEQRQYAAQLRESPHRAELASEAGAAFEHYTRTDRSGARPIPPKLLENWIAKGWLNRIHTPILPSTETSPCLVLDPFGGSGTTAQVAVELGRRAVSLDISAEYMALQKKRTRELQAPLHLAI